MYFVIVTYVLSVSDPLVKKICSVIRGWIKNGNYKTKSGTEIGIGAGRPEQEHFLPILDSISSRRYSLNGICPRRDETQREEHIYLYRLSVHSLGF